MGGRLETLRFCLPARLQWRLDELNRSHQGDSQPEDGEIIGKVKQLPSFIIKHVEIQIKMAHSVVEWR